MTAPAPWVFPALPPPPPSRGSRRSPFVLGVALVVSFALVVLVGVSSSDASSLHAPYSFMATSSDGSPFQWDPCSPIHYEVDLEGQPVTALPDIHEAVRRTAEASGLDFEFDGVVVAASPLELIESEDFVSSPSDGLYRWSPVLITFAPSETFRDLGAPPGAIGLGAPVTSRYDPDQYVSGLIVVNSDAPLAPGFEHAASLGPVIEHELGHVLGLAHVFNPAQLMYPAPIVPDWSEGDVAGLRRLSSGPCLVVPSAFPNGATLI